MDPFKQMGDWKKNMDHFFGENFWNEFEGIIKPTIPQINVYHTENEITCILNIPGLTDLNKIDIFVDYAALEINGVIDIQHQGGTVVKEEILQGAFDRRISLPFPVRSDKIKASYKNGIVLIQLYRLISDASSKHRVPVRLLEDK
ncbi:Hsp20/alpha crystallin family protein [Virgibacillus ndiopensis]|uniref:Hsp20/alpha crystallin family protein n=1 Tax=Virgibacillus ndiopensis TaxID=2004408 RepID=UPI000C08A801|nr:Hsp20/alpha crystallin family protein [Virgibacillus ndiopensis]